MLKNNSYLDLPKKIIPVGSLSYLCKGDSPDNRRIEVEDIPFYSLNKLVVTFPELIHHPGALARCANFLFTGETFRVITDPNVFIREYLQTKDTLIATKYGKANLAKMHAPKFMGNSFVFFVWNEVNDMAYCVRCAYPFINNHNDIQYSLFIEKPLQA
ncbi:MAG: hypothetical protein WC222_07530 [Parachlamydiales bacterium]|jgi:hypothetical protein